MRSKLVALQMQAIMQQEEVAQLAAMDHRGMPEVTGQC